MVGVPRSKGCILCLHRSVKCDETRPSCSQCRRGGRTCPGYTRAMKFVDEGSKLRHSTQSAKTRPYSRRSVKISNACNPVSAAMQEITANVEYDVNKPFCFVRNSRSQCSTLMYRLSSSVQDRTQLLASFISDMFPLGIISVQKSFLGSWLWHVPTRFGGSEVLDYAALSLALAYFARVSRNQLVLRNAEQCYSMALRALAAAVAAEHKRFGADVLCATMLLGSYEAFSHRSHGWIWHAGGAARLMQLRGASSCYESAFEYSMYLSCRGTIIAEALVSGEPCFLDTAEWRAIPEGLIEFPLLPKSPELYHAFFGYIAVIPGLLNRVNSMNNDTPKSDRLSLFSCSQTLRQDLMLWYDQYITSDDGLRRPILVKESTRQGLGPSDSVYFYNDTLSATVITTYYAYLIVLNNAITRLQADISYFAENLKLAQAICLSANYCSHAGHCGTQTMRFSLPIASKALSGEYPGWAEAWLEKF